MRAYKIIYIYIYTHAFIIISIDIIKHHILKHHIPELRRR